MDKKLIWKSKGITGQENLLLRQTKDGIVVTSEAKGGDIDLGTTWDATYSLTCNSSWQTRSFIAREYQTDRYLELYSNGNGHWEDKNKKELKDIAGCVDIDFRATPFSNTLPIRRLNLAVGESAIINVVYINAPDLEVSKEQQIYTRLSEYAWRFEQPSADFQATIVVDDEGFVVDYPGLFYRE